MKLNEIVVKSGSVSSIKNIEEINEKWRLEKSDPQIEITFQEPVDKFRIITESDLDFYSSSVEIFYRSHGENFSEERKISFSRLFSRYTYTDVYLGGLYSVVRIDLANTNIICKFNKFIVLPVQDISIEEEMENNIHLSDEKINDKILIISHDFSNTGAPILALNIAKKLKEASLSVITLCLNDLKRDLEVNYKKEGLDYFFINDFSHAKYSFYGNVSIDDYVSVEDMRIKMYVSALRNLGFKKVITNTVVSGALVPTLKEYDFLIVSLVHEMANSILLYNFVEYGNYIAKYSDFIIFPDELVKRDFLDIYSECNGETMIRPQGVYLQTEFNLMYEETEKKYGISFDKNYVMSSGTAELRKGVDLFVNAAIILASKFENLDFIWTGDFNNKELESWIKYQVKKSNLKNRIHFLPFISDKDIYRTLLQKASVFWLPSREDPFPSVVLEALAYGVPVIGFSNSGGFRTMAMGERAISLATFDCYRLAEETKKILLGDLNQNQNAVKKYIDSLDFGEYCKFLLGLTNQLEKNLFK